MIVRCRGCGKHEELDCLAHYPCNKTWLARARGWYVDQKKGTYCKECCEENQYYETERTEKQAQAIGFTLQDSHVCRSCRKAALEICEMRDDSAWASPHPQAAAAAGAEKTPDSASSSDGSGNDLSELRIWRRKACPEAPAEQKREAAPFPGKEVPSPPAGPPPSPPLPASLKREAAPFPGKGVPSAKQQCQGWCGDIAPEAPLCGCSRTWLARAMRWTGEKKKLYCPACSADRGFGPTTAAVEEARSMICRNCKKTASQYLSGTMQ